MVLTMSRHDQSVLARLQTGLRAHIDNQGRSHADVAAEANACKSSLSKFLGGETIRLDILIALGEAAGLALTWAPITTGRRARRKGH